MTTGLAPRLAEFVSAEELARLQEEAEAKLQEEGRWGTTFTVIQSWGRRAGDGRRPTTGAVSGAN